MTHYEDTIARVYAETAKAHEAEHYRCEQLGEGAGVPVVCSCDERFGPTLEEWLDEQGIYQPGISSGTYVGGLRHDDTCTSRTPCPECVPA